MQQLTNRTVKVPIQWGKLTDEQYKEIRTLALKCAAYGNALLSESYAKAKGLTAQWAAYTDWNQELSSAIRDAVGREVVGMWRRLGRDILSGRQTLGRFSAGRALCIRDRGVSLSKNGQGLEVHLRLFPSPAPQTVLLVYLPPKDVYLKKTLAMLEQEPERLTKATVVFDRRNARKIFVFLSYQKDIVELRSGGETATVVVLSDGTMRAHCAGRALTLTGWVYQAVSMKENVARIHARLRSHLGRTQTKSARKALRKKLAHTQSFEMWCQNAVHQVSRQITNFAIDNGAASVTWQIDQGAPDLPWFDLKEKTKYKLRELGISQTKPIPKQKKSLRKKQAEQSEKTSEIASEK